MPKQRLLVTWDQLDRNDACPQGRTYFAKNWGARCDVTRAILERTLRERPDYVYWLLMRHLGAWGDARLCRIHDAACSLYSRLARHVPVYPRPLGRRGDLVDALHAVVYLPALAELRAVALECFDIPE